MSRKPPPAVAHPSERTCLRCRAMGAEPGSVEWWALQFCAVCDVPFNEPLQMLLAVPELPLWDEMDGPTRKRVQVAHMAGWCARRSPRANATQTTQCRAVTVVINHHQVKRLVAEGFQLRRAALPNGDIELVLER